MNLNWKILAVIGLVMIILIIALFRNKKCRKEGEKLGMPYRCKFFDTEPTTLIAEDHYYGKRDGKCYKIIDYGNNMNIRRVSLDHCGESEPPKKVETVEDAEYIFD